MDAQPLTEQLQSEPRKLHASPENESEHSAPCTEVRRSWSLKRLLSGRGSRQYRVLEREPNRLRKRVST
ncbi:uncharacterized protein N7498_008245 [Penicillium cinerascens]|uniref:Uncharacterized protein n=1 Tax=Penicillium cinerascens TaxID=70096 RepID=A0A9W9JEJ4_9EURO|nr:uncharacterized protein N7498_008245 [Penicillium cinerascens]KAJ5194807.1 hypothetical protein N7498_008245 [Penicillium cinerascens]